MFVNGSQPKKDDLVQTPEWLVNRIYGQINRKQYKNIVDIGAYDGRLSAPFKRIKGSHITGVDILNDYSNNFDNFIHEPFLETTKDVYNAPDLIIMNPPFSDIQPMRFIEHCNELFGKNIPIVAIVPTYIMDNSKKRSHELNQLNITRTIILDTYTFGKAARLHTQIIFINIPFRNKKPYEYWYEPKKQKNTKGKYRSVYMNKKDEENIQILLKKYSGNFNKMIKSLIENEVERVN